MTLSPEIELLEDSNEILVHRNGEKLHTRIEQQLMQLLLLLAANEGKLVEKQTFINQVWNGNNFTGDAALTKNIFKLREIFKTNEIETISIETIPKKGYRLLIKKHIPPAQRKVANYSRTILLTLLVMTIFCGIFFMYRPGKPVVKNIPLVSIDGEDTLIQLGKKKVQVIHMDTGERFISLDSLKP